jgi:hypothetical protein
MASHGRRGFTALLLGSETNKVLTHSKIPGARLSLIIARSPGHRRPLRARLRPPARPLPVTLLSMRLPAPLRPSLAWRSRQWRSCCGQPAAGLWQNALGHWDFRWPNGLACRRKSQCRFFRCDDRGAWRRGWAASCHAAWLCVACWPRRRLMSGWPAYFRERRC